MSILEQGRPAALAVGARPSGSPVLTNRYPPLRALHSVDGDVTTRLLHADSIYADLRPMEQVTVHFPYVLPIRSRVERDVVLVSSGYVLSRGGQTGASSAPASRAATNRQLANRLEQNVPNPFNPATSICYRIEKPGRVTIRVYSVRGELVRTLVDEEQHADAGGRTVIWDGRDDRGSPPASGVYLYRIEAGGFSAARKMVLIR